MSHLCRSQVLLSVVVAFTVSWSHHSRADAPAGRYTMSNGTVFDKKTLLTWQQGIAPNPLNWNDAKVYCDNLVLDGKSDWRLPSMKELQTIVDEKKTNPAIDPIAFPNTPADWFWTSSGFGGSGSQAWVVDFSSGDTYGDDVVYSYRVRCAR